MVRSRLAQGASVVALLVIASVVVSSAGAATAPATGTAGVGGASPSPSPDSSQMIRAAAAWTGTVKVVEDVDYTATPMGYVTHVVYHDQADYTLRGQVSAAGAQVADMTGSGVGRSTVTFPNGCVRLADPYYQWSYTGPAGVAVSFANGRWVVAPQFVMTTYSGVAQAACGQPSQTSSFQRAAPGGAQDPPAGFQPQGQSAAANATSLSGSEKLSFAPVFALPTLRIGTATLSWNLRRASLGTSGRVTAFTPYIHTDAAGRRWVYGKGQVNASCPNKKITATLDAFSGDKWNKVGGPVTKTGSGVQCVLSASAAVHCAKPYTASKFRVVVAGWTYGSDGWHHEATKKRIKQLAC